jgi:hypothetical protein
MINRSSLSSVFTLLALFALTLFAPTRADAEGACGGGWVDGAGYTNQSVGCASEDSHLSGVGAYYGECYGQCGKGCSWYNCGSGGACQNHDYYTRTQGFWSGAALGSFGAAIVQWGKCIAGKGAQYITGNEYSKWTGAQRSAYPRVGY